MSARSAVIAVVTVGFVFVACGGRSSLDSGQVFGGGAGIAGAGAGGGVGGTLGRGGTNGRGNTGGSIGFSGASVGGSDGFGGVGGASFGGSAGFGGSRGFGGSTAFGGSNGFGGTAGFGGSIGTGGFGGAAGSGPSCDALPGPCLSCMCRTCNSELLGCVADQGCFPVASCFLRTDCLRSGTCERACAWPLITAAEDSVTRAARYVRCVSSSGCPCNFGTGGAGGTGGSGGAGGAGGTAGVGGSAASGGAGGSTPVDCESCYRSYCPQFAACVDDASCRGGINCASVNCYQPDWEPSCVAACFSPALGRQMFSALQCMTARCRPWCGTPNGP